MKPFDYINARRVDEAAALLAEGNAAAIAGGTDLLCVLKDHILAGYPGTLVNLKTIPGLDFIRETEDGVAIGALTRLSDIASSSLIREGYTALAQAAAATASPHLREMGTIAGNLCQLPRCWYFRKAENRFACARKGGRECYALTGDNRYHSIFGAVRISGSDVACCAVNSSDTAPALIALDASIVTNKRKLAAERFFDARYAASTVLDPDEIIVEINLPKPAEAERSVFVKFAFRKSIDFPIVNLAVRIGSGSPRVCLNAVAPVPYRARGAEILLSGAGIRPAEDVIAAAAAAAMSEARPFPASRFKVQIAKTIFIRLLGK